MRVSFGVNLFLFSRIDRLIEMESNFSENSINADFLMSINFYK